MCAAFSSIFRPQLSLWYNKVVGHLFIQWTHTHMQVAQCKRSLRPYWMLGCSLLTSPVTIFPSGSGWGWSSFPWFRADITDIISGISSSDSYTQTQTHRHTDTQTQTQTHTHTHTHTHTRWFLWFTGTLHRRNGFYTVQTVCAIALHLPLT